MLGRATGNSNTQDSPRPSLGGSHHLPPYSILCSSPRGPHPNGFSSRDSQVEVLKFPQLGLLQLWGRITSCAELWSWWGIKQSCNPCREFSNTMSHVTCTQGNRVDSWLLVVGNQTPNLTPSLSFGHNLCYRCSNGQCEPVLDIYASITFSNDTHKSSKQWVLTLAILLWRFGSPFGIPTPNMGVHLGVWGFIPSHSLHS